MQVMLLAVPVVLGLVLGVNWVADRVRYRAICTMRLRQFDTTQS